MSMQFWRDKKDSGFKRVVPVLFSAALVVACTSGSKDTSRTSPTGGQTAEVDRGSTQMSAPNTPQTGKRPTVLFVGTSLTAGYGLEADQAYPAVIERIADSVGLPMTAVNLGVSGETSAGALRRMDWILKSPADLVVVETGANDALRGLSVRTLRSNLESIVEKIQTAKPGIPILLIQMEAPPNYGSDYTSDFRKVYTEVSREKGVPLAPFLLDKVAGNASLNQPDGIHPSIEGARIVAQNIWASLRPMIAALPPRP